MRDDKRASHAVQLGMRARLRRAAILLTMPAMVGLAAACTPQVGSPATAALPSVLTASPDAQTDLRIRRLTNLDQRLHPLVSALIHEEHEEAAWADDGLVTMPASRCAAALGTSEVTTNSCTLISIGDGRAALLVLGAPRGCQGASDPCVERSFVFLSRHPVPLALPARRLSDFYALRDALPRAQAGALWMAGFRSMGEAPNTAQREDFPIDSSRVAYRTCAVSDDEETLLCRSRTGDLVSLDPRAGSAQVVARLGLPAEDLDLSGPASEQAPWWTAGGRVAMRVSARRHPLCGDAPCELVGLVDARDAHAAVKLVRSTFETIPYADDAIATP